jgi:hypothetical protein
MQNTLRNIFATKYRLDMDNYLKKNHATRYDGAKHKHTLTDDQKNVYLENFLRTGNYIKGVTKYTRSELGVIDLSSKN